MELKEDDRGFFSRLFCQKEFSRMGLNTNWVQINNSFSKKKSTLRGLHYQKDSNSEVKLIRCIRGEIWDVIVDLREKSKTYGKWYGARLSDKNRSMIYVPRGCAHGFITLKPDTEVFYLVSNFYSPETERTLSWNDKTVDINWPILPRVISEKDKKGLKLEQISPIKLKN